MKKHLITACLYTAITAVILGILYPLAITGLANIAFKNKAEGQLIQRNGGIVGSKLIGQTFTGSGYFHGRPSAAGSGYDASASSGSNLAPTSKSLLDRVNKSVADESSDTAVPVDLVTASASGLDPDISPAAAFYQVARVARERHLSEDALRQLVTTHTTQRQLGLLGEPRVNVLQLNLDLDNMSQSRKP
jgi:potassium-transporting ATPase KdpC subunit